MEFNNEQSVDQGHPLMTLDDVDMEQCIPKLFSNPSVSYVGVHLYAKVGVILAPYLDGTSLNKSSVATEQFKLYDIIVTQMDMLVESIGSEI